MKKNILILIFVFSLSFVGFCFPATMINNSYYDKDGRCHVKQTVSEVDAGSCSTAGAVTYDVATYACTNTCSWCGYSDSCSPSSLCNLFVNSVGGCNDTPKYCSTSPVYQQVAAFLGVIENASRFSYYSTIGQDNNIYKCVLSYTRSSGQTVILIAGAAMSAHNPVGAPDCVSSAAFDALINTNCALGSGWAVNSGYATNYRDGTAVTQNPDDAEGSVVPAGSTPVGPTGSAINSPTGFDANKDGFDDVTGQPIPFSPSGSGTAAKVEIENPKPSDIPAVPSGGEYDTDIDSPEQKTLSDLFGIIDSSPFVSVLHDTKIQLSGSQCHLTTSSPVFGQYVSFDFCDSRLVSILDYLGIIIVGIAAIMAILLIFV